MGVADSNPWRRDPAVASCSTADRSDGPRTIMRILYHEFESLEHLLTNRLLPGGTQRPIRFVIFGGTGAVGGAAVMELCRMILMSKSLRQRSLQGEIHATGMSDKEISKFVSRLYLALGEEHEIEKIEPRRHYRVDHRIDLRFAILQLEIPQDLPDHVRQEHETQGEGFRLETTLANYFRKLECPFLRYVESLGDLDNLLLHAVAVSIPLPSVATYTLVAIDRLADEHGLDHASKQRVKKSYLKTFVRGLAVIQQRHARHVLIAHTTAVGGMYRVDGGQSEIRLGFAHSALGKKLVDKKYFADELTQLYIDQGFDVLVTAAAIGIDAVEFHCHLPADRAVKAALQMRLRQIDHSPVHPGDLDNPNILLYPCRSIPLQSEGSSTASTASTAEAEVAPKQVVEHTAVDPEADEAGSVTERKEPAFESSDTETITNEPSEANGSTDEASKRTEDEAHQGPPDVPFEFGAGKELMVDAAIRSGENGLFSVANCVALYNVMKVAIPEELAMVLVRHALFGPERRRDWFRDKICYYNETENSYFALRLLDNYPQLVQAHHGAFAPQAYQALGSSTHQARLHELGLLMLALRMRELRGKFMKFSEKELAENLTDLDSFLRRHTRIPCFEDLVEIEISSLSKLLSQLCQVNSMESAGQVLGYDPHQTGLREPGREKFLARLATRISRYLQTITSLGIPLIYRRTDGTDHLLVGPYIAPLDTALAYHGDLERVWQERAERHGIPTETMRDWVIVNNGFIDLRPHAMTTSAKEAGPQLVHRVHTFENAEDVAAWIGSLEQGDYFTTCGLVALELRLGQLFQKVSHRKIELGTRETWKHLFQQDLEGRHILSPGLVETVRMYSEGLGKITGTEALWPPWGY